MTRNIQGTGLCAIMALSLGLFAFAGDAHAEFTVMVDCHGDNGEPKWAGTKDTIKFEALINQNWVTIASKAVPDCSNEDHPRFKHAGNAQDVTKLRISTSGSDAFWVDELVLLNGSGHRVKTWGVDNNVGYCFSTKASDGENNAYCWNGAANPEQTFR